MNKIEYLVEDIVGDGKWLFADEETDDLDDTVEDLRIIVGEVISNNPEPGEDEYVNNDIL